MGKGIVKVMFNTELKKVLVCIAIATILSWPSFSFAVTAEIKGAPSGLTNQTNPVISIYGDGVVSYRYSLDGGNYSAEIPVSTNINFSADVSIFGQKFLGQYIAGSVDLQYFLDSRASFINNVTLENVSVDTPIVYLLNSTSIALQTDNTLTISGSNIDQLEVYMNNSPTIPAVVVSQSPGSITYDLQTDTPQRDYIRIINNSASTASFSMNLNNMLYTSDADVLNAIQSMPPEYMNEPTERKAWRFIINNRYHWDPITSYSWGDSSPALFFNSIGFGFCSDSAALYCYMMSSLGYQARVWGMNGHVVPEVLINGTWEMYDPDKQVYYIDNQGNVAGVQELESNPGLITNPIVPLQGTLMGAYSQVTANIYSSAGINDVQPQQCINDNSVANYLLNMQIPAGGAFDFPAVFAAPIHTLYFTQAPSYTNARLTIPSGWTGTLNTPLVIHSIGYDGPHTFSVIAKDSAGNWQAEPTVANWTTDSWAPITTPSQSSAAGPVTLAANKPATIYYTLDGSFPTTNSLVYNNPINTSSFSVLSFFAVDMAGNSELAKNYDPLTGNISIIDIPVTGVTVAMNQQSPQSSGANITFTAAASGGTGNYQYYFTVFNPNSGTWSIGQPYGSNASWTWNTTSLGAGAYSIQVWARSTGSAAAYEAWTSVQYTLIAPQPPPVTGVTLTMNQQSPQQPGAQITFAAAASGGSGSYQYYFIVFNPNTGKWSVGQAYSSNASWTWNTTGLGTGTYTIQVWARSAGSTAAYEAWTSVNYSLIPPPPPPATGVTLTMNQQSPQQPGAQVTFTAAASGGSGSYQYYFIVFNPNTGKWSVGQAYSSNASWTWNTTGLGSGTYAIQVWARSVGSTAAYDAWTGVTYTLTLNPPAATGVTLTMNQQSPQQPGAQVTFTAAASGGSGSYQYYFIVFNPNTGKWSVGQAYSSNASWTWDTTGLGTGTYAIQVWARSVGSTAAYDTWKGVTYTLNAI